MLSARAARIGEVQSEHWRESRAKKCLQKWQKRTSFRARSFVASLDNGKAIMPRSHQFNSHSSEKWRQRSDEAQTSVRADSVRVVPGGFARPGAPLGAGRIR